ncbi:short-chain dehydrogenase [Paraflavitalea pollutisoli]|uniref:short-chain dehydrogenase n=1 Tax=Paraflavitalea pollutisoli TaxID=3034143 RepID=UPI0023EBB47D|nr:short-chain dehydrogenase [Paraflavitalea sp. H1-2-19X]
MTIEQIHTFLTRNEFDRNQVKVSFKTRNSFTGIFIKTNDYTELKDKNFWRVINESNVKEYLKSKDTSLARIFNGSEFVKLTTVQDAG